MGGSDGRIGWTYTPRTSRLLRVLTYVPLAVLGGVLVLGICLLALLVIDALLTGDVRQLAIVAGVVLAVVFATVRGPAAIWLLPDERERLASEFEVPLDARTLLGASALGAVVLFVAIRIELWMGTAIFLGGMAMLIVVGALRSDGAIDPEELTLEYDTRNVSLAALRNVRSVTIGSLAVCWLSFERGSFGVHSPRLVVLPVDAYRRARPVFERAIDEPTEAGRTASRAERAVYLAFGLGLLAVGPLSWVLTPPGPDAGTVVLLAGGTTGVFGLLFVWFALVG